MLEDLIRVIETIQNRIREHGQLLRGHKTRTRTALIDPLLTALGWDVADPEFILAEDVGNGAVEYLLFRETDNPVAAITTVGLGDDIDPHRQGIFSTFEESKDLYYCLTDGDHWELYDAIRPLTPQIKAIMDINVATTSAPQCAKQVLKLAKSNLGWVALSLLSDPTGTNHPGIIRFPDDSQKEIEAWYQIPKWTSQWLWKNNLLTSSNVPVPSGHKLYIVSLNSQHRNGDPFSTRIPIDGTPLFLEGKVSAKAAIRYTEVLLTHCGQDPSSVYLKLN